MRRDPAAYRPITRKPHLAQEYQASGEHHAAHELTRPLMPRALDRIGFTLHPAARYRPVPRQGGVDIS